MFVGVFVYPLHLSTPKNLGTIINYSPKKMKYQNLSKKISNILEQQADQSVILFQIIKKRPLFISIATENSPQ